jgi:hypothetical protein
VSESEHNESGADAETTTQYENDGKPRLAVLLVGRMKQLAAELGETKEANGRGGASQRQYENFIEAHSRSIGRPLIHKLPQTSVRMTFPRAGSDERRCLSATR